jgi:hypothetical protein
VNINLREDAVIARADKWLVHRRARPRSLAGQLHCVAWVSGGGDERDPQRFWLPVLGALRLHPGVGRQR